MRKITLLLITTALLFVGVESVQATKTNWNPSSWVASWNGETKTMSWKGTDGYKLIATNFPTGNLSAYTKIRATITSITGENDYIQLKVVSEGKNDQLINLTEGVNNVVFSSYDINLNNVTELTLWGTGNSDGSAVIREMYLYNPHKTISVGSFGDAVTSFDYITEGNKFVISDNGTKAKFFKTNNENENAEVADVPADAYFYFTLEKYTGDAVSGDNIYKIKVTNAAGDGYPRGTSGGYYLNAIKTYNSAVIAGPEAGWSEAGNELKDALWYVSYDAENGFSFQNVYRIENSASSWLSLNKNFSSDKVYLKLYKSIGFVNTSVDDTEVVDENVNITIDSETRNYQLYVPGNVSGNCPLVISLHGAGGASTSYIPFKKEVADAEGCIVAYPQGKDILWGNSTSGWDATGQDNADVEFLKAVIEDVASKYSIDRKRIYCCGFSNGGMMTYAMANACSDEIAAFASISGFPLNEFHLRHTGSRPVPFMHIHGKADDFVDHALMPTIVDEMVARMGANPASVPTSVSGKYTKTVYEAGNGSFPYVYYEIDGMGHADYTENTEDGNSALTMWNFFEQYTLDSSCDPTLKWAPRIETTNFLPASHGWTVNSGTTLLQFGGDQNTGSDGNHNVYHSLQFDNGHYKLSFNSSGASVSIGVKIEKLTSPNTVVLNETVNVGADAELPFEVTDGWGEYKLTITRPSADDAITVSNVVIKESSASGGETPVETTGNHYLEITTNQAKNNAWEWAIWYQLATPLVEGKTYVLTMDAKCSENFQMGFWPVNTAEGGKTLYTGYSIGTEWSTCTCEFTANDALNRLSWDFGSLNGYLRFDNVKLVEKGTDTNLMTGGDFESGLASNWGNDGWNKPEYSIYETESTPTRYLKMTTNSVKDNAWEWAVWYRLDTPLEKNKTYVLTMKAKCSEVYTMPFWPYKTDGGVNYTGYGIGTEWGECSCTFTAVDDLTHLKWCFGSLNGTVCFDDVKLVEQGTTTNLINGGDFEEGLASNWGDDSWNKPQYGAVIEYPLVEATSSTEAVYVFSGDIKDGMITASAQTAMADADARVLDVTGIIGKDWTLTSANPNCLFIANDGTLTNTNNVIVGSTCADLALSDGYPFKAPVGFAATAASYNRTFTADNTTTVCLPFALTSDEAASLGTFYAMDGFDGATIHFESVDEPAANTPYLVVPSNTSLALSGGKDIAITPANLGTGTDVENIEFIGTLSLTEIPASDNTYSYYAYNNGTLVKIVTQSAKLPAFRGYFKVTNSAIGGARSLNISFGENKPTGIQDVNYLNDGGKMDIYFDLQGRRVATPQKGLYIVNGKKVIK